MSEQSPEPYDPMSLHSEIDEIYTSSEVLEAIRAQRSIIQETTKYRPQEIIRVPDLFGERGVDNETHPPVAP